MNAESNLFGLGQNVLKTSGIVGLIAIILVGFMVYLYVSAIQQMTIIHMQILQNGEESLVVLKDIKVAIDAQTRLLYRNTPLSLR